MNHKARQRASAIVAAAVLTLSALGLSAAGAGAAATRHAPAGPAYGGTLHVAYTSNMVTFDPAQAYSDDWWIMMGTLYNGLYQFDRGGQPQLDLAAAPPTISADRTVWTFQLRRGVRFHNGMELTASDVKFSITRTLDPHLKPAVSWGQSADDIFQGSHAFVTGKATGVAGIQVLGRYTVRFVLAHPVAILPDILAESFNMVVPQAVVTKESPDYFASHPIGTGPFMLQTWRKGSQAVFVKNPHYFHTGKPYLDKIVAESGVAPSLLALRVEKGELDGFGEATEIGAADLAQARGDPKLARYLVAGPTTFVVWLDLDVHVPPLDQARVRQAIAMALDRTRLVRLLAGNAVPANQLYVPVYPQYDATLDRRPIYPYNPNQAAALLKAGGYHGQPISLLYSSDLPYEVSMVPGIQQDLRQIGLNVTLRGATNTSVSATVASQTGHQISVYVWSIVFSDAFDVYAAELTCGANAPGAVAGAHFCDPLADSLVNQAEALPLGAARDALLRRAQQHLLQAAAHVPLVFLKTVEMVSPQVGGFYYQPEFGWQFESYWIKR